MTENALMNTYGTRTTTLHKGEGVYLWDTTGKRYLDALSGIAVCGLGHCHPAVTRALTEQAETLVHCSNLYMIEPQVKLGETLVNISGLEKVFFTNSGTEANEAAIKIARKYGTDKGITSPEIITTNGSFHGRTMGALSATGNPKVKKGFEPHLTGFPHVEYGDIDAIKNAATDNTVAVMLEPIQGEGGIKIPPAEFLPQLRALCDANGWLLILDEIQTGNGRTGKYFAYQHHSILPDIVTTAKGLGNGVPIGACIAKGIAAKTLQPGNHGTTFGGNPLATNAALAVVEELTKNESALIQRVEKLGDLLVQHFKTQLENNAAIVDIRGQGLMIGIELDRPCAELVEIAKKHGLMINVTAANTIRLLPPFIITDDQAEEIVTLLCSAIDQFLKQEL